MSTTRSQKIRNNHQESVENVSENLISPIMAENSSLPDQDIFVAWPSNAKSPRIEGSLFENLRTSMEEEIQSEIKGFR